MLGVPKSVVFFNTETLAICVLGKSAMLAVLGKSAMLAVLGKSAICLRPCSMRARKQRNLFLDPAVPAVLGRNTICLRSCSASCTRKACSLVFFFVFLFFYQCSMCLLLTLHASHQTANYQQQKNTKSVLTQIYIKQNIHKQGTHTHTHTKKKSKN